MTPSFPWKRFTLALLLLASLFAGLELASRDLAASQPCASCESNYDACIDECINGPWQSACYQDCTTGYNRCLRTCT